MMPPAHPSVPNCTNLQQSREEEQTSNTIDVSGDQQLDGKNANQIKDSGLHLMHPQRIARNAQFDCPLQLQPAVRGYGPGIGSAKFRGSSQQNSAESFGSGNYDSPWDRSCTFNSARVHSGPAEDESYPPGFSARGSHDTGSGRTQLDQQPKIIRTRWDMRSVHDEQHCLPHILASQHEIGQSTHRSGRPIDDASAPVSQYQQWEIDAKVNGKVPDHIPSGGPMSFTTQYDNDYPRGRVASSSSFQAQMDGAQHDSRDKYHIPDRLLTLSIFSRTPHETSQAVRILTKALFASSKEQAWRDVVESPVYDFMREWAGMARRVRRSSNDFTVEFYPEIDSSDMKLQDQLSKAPLDLSYEKTRLDDYVAGPHSHHNSDHMVSSENNFEVVSNSFKAGIKSKCEESDMDMDSISGSGMKPGIGYASSVEKMNDDPVVEVSHINEGIGELQSAESRVNSSVTEISISSDSDADVPLGRRISAAVEEHSQARNESTTVSESVASKQNAPRRARKKIGSRKRAEHLTYAPKKLKTDSRRKSVVVDSVSESDEARPAPLCSFCGEGDDVDMMAICINQHCESAMHCFCMQPPLRRPPRSWQCPKCTARQDLRNGDGSEDEADYESKYNSSEEEKSEETDFKERPRIFKKSHAASFRATNPAKVDPSGARDAHVRNFKPSTDDFTPEFSASSRSSMKRRFGSDELEQSSIHIRRRKRGRRKKLQKGRIHGLDGDANVERELRYAPHSIIQLRGSSRKSVLASDSPVAGKSPSSSVHSRGRSDTKLKGMPCVTVEERSKWSNGCELDEANDLSIDDGSQAVGAMSNQPASCSRTLGYEPANKKAKTSDANSTVIGSAAQDHRMSRLKSRQRSRHAMATSSGVLSSEVNVLDVRKKKLRLGRSPIHAWGVFALQVIEERDMIIEYIGEVIRSNVAELREKRYEKQGIGSSYLFRIDGDWVCDATFKGNLARFINHSCDPNCYTRIISVTGKKRIAIYSRRRIEVGEELNYDYKFPLEPDAKIPCWCGANKCRGTLN